MLYVWENEGLVVCNGGIIYKFEVNVGKYGICVCDWLRRGNIFRGYIIYCYVLLFFILEILFENCFSD